MIWMFSGSALTKLAMVAGGMALLNGPLDNNNTWVAGNSVDAPPNAWRLSTITNANHWKQASEKSKGIVLDLEHWPFTPIRQQTNPVETYQFLYQRLSTLQGRHWIVAAPAFDLVKEMEPGYRGKIYPKFIQMRLAAGIAPNVQVYDIQAQGAENNPGLYRSMIWAIARQVHKANPKAIILAGISTNPSGQSVSVSRLMDDIKQTRYMVSGYWLTIPQANRSCPQCGRPEPQKAVNLLDHILGHRR